MSDMKRFRDDIAEVCHEIVEDGYRCGIIGEEEMREFEAGCFVEEPAPAYGRPVSEYPKTAECVAP